MSTGRSATGNRPNYALRRIMALLVLVLLIVVVTRVVGGVAALFEAGGGTAAGGTPSGPPTEAAPTTVAPPVCTYGKDRAPVDGYDQWELTLLDTNLRLPRTYVPPELVSLSEAGFGQSPLMIRSLVVGDLSALRDAAAAAGHPVAVVAAYRSYEQQASLFDRRKRDLGLEAALNRTARPGHSEHQLGTSIDFKTRGDVDVDRSWASTPTGAWMQENAWRFGFVLSYPKDRADVTCYASEPWHFRYFGRDLARQIHDSGFTVREFLWNRQQVGGAPIP